MREAAITIALVAAGGLVAACGPGPRNNGGDDTGGGIDASGTVDTLGGDTGAMNFVYAHTDQQLYKVDPDTYAISLIGAFQWKLSDGTPTTDTMTDLAINKDNLMIGLSFSGVYHVDPMTAEANLIGVSPGGSFNGLSFVPADSIGQTGDDILVGTGPDDGMVSQIDPVAGTVTPIGNMGSAFMSSGDLCSVKGFGTVQTTNGAPHDVLVRLASNTFAATAVGTDTGFDQIYGLAFWKGTIFGFTLTGEFITIDPGTGKGTLVQKTGNMWYGAAVKTTAPILQ